MSGRVRLTGAALGMAHAVELWLGDNHFDIGFYCMYSESTLYLLFKLLTCVSKDHCSHSFQINSVAASPP